MKCVRLFVAAFAFAAVVGGDRLYAQTVPFLGDVAAQVSLLRLGEFDAFSTGIGARVTKGVSRSLSIDGEFVFAPRDNFTDAHIGLSPSGGVTYRRSRMDGFLGIKAGHRFDRIGIFAKVRPGFSRLTHKGVGCTGEVCALILVAVPEYEPEFALDLGAVIEFYSSERLLTRIDVGDTLIRHRGFAPPCSNCSSHNFASKFGVGFRF